MAEDQKEIQKSEQVPILVKDHQRNSANLLHESERQKDLTDKNEMIQQKTTVKNNHETETSRTPTPPIMEIDRMS